MSEAGNTPNEELGKIIVERLISEGLIVPEEESRMLDKICGGRMTASEWKACLQAKILKDEGVAEDDNCDQKD